VSGRSIAKKERHRTILAVVRSHRIRSQEELRRLLLAEGFEATQATLSRDIRELRLVKVPASGGTSHYTVADERETTPPLERLLPTLFISAEGAGNLIVVRTRTGGAQAVALGMDWEEWPEVLGTVAGDDTILIVLREPKLVPAVKGRIEEIAGTTAGAVEDAT
jgi:transcriptional regulator of arginine metabolism